MAEEKVKKPKKIVLIKMPSYTRLLIGGLTAYCLSTIMNPAFVAIAVLVILMIPVLTVDDMFSQQFHRAYNPPAEIQPKVMTKSEYLEIKTAEEAAKNPPPPPAPVKKTSLLQESRKPAPAATEKSTPTR